MTIDISNTWLEISSRWETNAEKNCPYIFDRGPFGSRFDALVNDAVMSGK